MIGTSSEWVCSRYALRVYICLLLRRHETMIVNVERFLIFDRRIGKVNGGRGSLDNRARPFLPGQ